MNFSVKVLENEVNEKDTNGACGIQLHLLDITRSIDIDIEKTAVVHPSPPHLGFR